MSPRPPGPSANWITAGWWQNRTGQPITSFRATWQVPPVPATQGSQLIYLFNGMEPANFSTILQPVLQWGNSGSDEDGVQRTGPFWTVASWIVPAPDGQAHHTPHVRVNPGDTLVGVMTLLGQSGGLCSYECQFEGIAGTDFKTPFILPPAWCDVTLEAYENNTSMSPPYDLFSASEYPATGSSAFRALDIQTGGTAATGSWSPPQNLVFNYGEHTVIAVDSPTNGEVDIFYSSR
jgi:hypothetical protein